jgi:hypothetical protein
MHTDEIAERDRRGFDYLPISFRKKDLLRKVEEIGTEVALAALDSIYGLREEQAIGRRSR